MTTDPITDYSSDAETSFEELGSREAGRTHGLGPWHLAWRRLKRTSRSTPRLNPSGKALTETFSRTEQAPGDPPPELLGFPSERPR